MNLEVGDLAVYPAHGVGRIEAVEERTLSGQAYSFYVMRILENGMKIMIPAQNMDAIGLRPVIKKGQVKKIYDLLKAPFKAPDTSNWNRRQRDYMDKLKTGSLAEVAEVLRELLTMRAEKELSFGERKLLDMARVFMVKEVALAKGQTEDKVEAEINGFFPPAKVIT